VTTALDTSACIYLLNGGERQRKVRAMLDGDSLLISAVTVTELLVLPFRSQDADAIALTEAFIEACEVISVSAEIARAAAVLRAAHSKLKTPDALIIATSDGRSDRVLGNDRAWIGICESFELVDADTR
jgi:predicted nucleic acid-binding protein